MASRRVRSGIAGWLECCALVLALGAAARAESVGAEGNVFVVRRVGVTAYESIVEEFADNCRVRAHLVALEKGNAAQVRAALRPGDIVLAVGQRALDVVAESPAQVIAAAALTVPRGVIAADTPAPPELVLRALKRARPSITRVGVVYGPATEALVRHAAARAPALGLTLVPIRAIDGPTAVRALRMIAARIDALWLAPDLGVLTPQLFQFALALQIKRAVPLAGVTRQQVQSGALLAYDADPHAVGRQAAELTHRLLAGESPAALRARERAWNMELTVNGAAARRIGADVAALRALGARIE